MTTNKTTSQDFPRASWKVEPQNGPAGFNGEAAIHSMEMMDGSPRYSAIIRTDQDDDQVSDAELHAVATRLALADNNHDTLVAALAAMHEKYSRLHDIVSDCIEGGKIKKADLPDDYQVIVESLAACDTANRQAADALAGVGHGFLGAHDDAADDEEISTQPSPA